MPALCYCKGRTVRPILEPLISLVVLDVLRETAINCNSVAAVGVPRLYVLADGLVLAGEEGELPHLGLRVEVEMVMLTRRPGSVGQSTVQAEILRFLKVAVANQRLAGHWKLAILVSGVLA